MKVHIKTYGDKSKSQKVYTKIEIAATKEEVLTLVSNLLLNLRDGGRGLDYITSNKIEVFSDHCENGFEQARGGGSAYGNISIHIEHKNEKV